LSELVVSVFEGEASAAQVLRALEVARPAMAGIASAATLSVSETGGYAVGTRACPGSGRGFSNIFWEAVFGLVFLVPVAGSSYGPGAGALFETVAHCGADEDFRARAREALVPGTSGVGLLLADDDAESALRFLVPRARTVIRARLTAEQDAALDRELGGPA